MKYFFIFLFSLFSFSIDAQDDWCGADEELEKFLNADPANRAKLEKQEADLLKFVKNAEHEKSSHLTIIPVVVHVMHYEGDGNISKEQIEDGIRILNEDLQLLNSDTSNIRSVFDTYKADFEIEFRLAQIDPNGNCTEGITRQSTVDTYSPTQRNDVKRHNYWDAKKYFNVWLVNDIYSGGSNGTILGYAQFPGTGSLSTFGIVVRHDEWGSIGSAVGGNGRTVTHEVGHCLNLRHTFEWGCGSNTSKCSNTGDYVCDTPPASYATFGCTTSNNNCSNDATQVGTVYTTNVPDMLENYMSYDDCQYMFTKGQKTRSYATLNSSAYDELYYLHQSTNLTATGTDDNHSPQLCAPIAEIIREKIYSCVGSEIEFSETSYNGKVSNWEWSFPGGTPSTSTDSIPVITYTNAGVYDYSLKVSNSSGADSISFSYEIVISDTNGMYSAYQYSEGFESFIQFSSDWIVENKSGNAKWAMNSFAAYSGNSSVYINNNLMSTLGEVESLISPSIDMTKVNKPSLKFQIAYAKKNSNSSDKLSIYTSINCGNTWQLKYVAPTYLLQADSVPDQTTSFVPQNTDEWKEIYFPIPFNLRSEKNVRFKFAFEAGGGNNIFMDSIRIEGSSTSTGIQKHELQAAMNIYPNPTSSDFTIQLDLTSKSRLIIEIRDIAGKSVKKISDQQVEAASYKFYVNTHDLSPGVYLVESRIGDYIEVQKVIIR